MFALQPRPYQRAILRLAGPSGQRQKFPDPQALRLPPLKRTASVALARAAPSCPQAANDRPVLSGPNPGAGCPLHTASKTTSNLIRMSTYAKCAANPCRMRTSKTIGLKASCNEPLQENGARGGPIVGQVVTLRVALSLTLAANGVIPLRGSKLTTEEILCVDLAT
jgi:hypothetical protein